MAAAAADFYAILGPGGLAGIAPEFTPADQRWLLRLVAGRTRILDAGCGYGRVAIPLAAAGHRVLGVDLDPGLIADARRRARGSGLPLRFQVGDIRALAVPPGGFDAVLCLWSTFQHLLTRRDRLAALRGFHAALRPGGICILEMTDGGEPGLAAELARRGRGPQRRIAAWTLRGARIRCFIHDAAALAATLADSPFARQRVSRRRIHGITRLVGVAWKAGPR